MNETCICGDRLAADCPGEWKPGCDLGNNPQHIRPAPGKLLLYALRVTYEAYVLANDAKEAESLHREVLRWEEPEVEVSSGNVDLSWPPDALVYHARDKDYDITLQEAQERYAVAD